MIAAAYVLVAAWLVLGLAIAVPFAFKGADGLPRVHAPLTLGARLLIIPGAAVLWPLVLRRWLASNERKSR